MIKNIERKSTIWRFRMISQIFSFLEPLMATPNSQSYATIPFHKTPKKCKNDAFFLPKNWLFCIIPFTRQGSIWSSSWRLLPLQTHTLKIGEKARFYRRGTNQILGVLLLPTPTVSKILMFHILHVGRVSKSLMPGNE